MGSFSVGGGPLGIEVGVMKSQRDPVDFLGYCSSIFLKFRFFMSQRRRNLVKGKAIGKSRQSEGCLRRQQVRGLA